MGDFGQDVARHEHGDALPGKGADECAQIFDADGVESVGGLVQDEELRVNEKRKREPQSLLHAHRERPDALLARVGEVDDVQHLVDTAFRQSEHRGTHAQVFGGGEVGVERRALDERADFVEIVAAPSVSVERDVAFGGAEYPREHLERGRFARAVGAEEPVDTPAPYVQADVGDRRLRGVPAPKALGEPVRFQYAVHVPSFRPLRRGGRCCGRCWRPRACACAAGVGVGGGRARPSVPSAFQCGRRI